MDVDIATTEYASTTDPRLDWNPAHDPRSLNYPFAAVAPTHVEDVPRRWRAGATLDQGQEGACVAFGWTQEALSSPRPDYLTNSHTGSAYAFRRYQRIRAIDQAMGNVWDSGASVLAGAKSAVELDHIDSYRWALSIEDVRKAVLLEGPVVIGIPWYSGMYDTYGRNGVVEVSGDLVGGHCILIDERHPGKRVSTPRGYETWAGYGWHNSWSDDYGHAGRGFIREEDLRDLLAHWGEACVPIGRRQVRLSRR
jgi:hypothetical protein